MLTLIQNTGGLALLREEHEEVIVDGLSCGTHRASARGVDFADIAVLVAPKDLGLNVSGSDNFKNHKGKGFEHSSAKISVHNFRNKKQTDNSSFTFVDRY